MSNENPLLYALLVGINQYIASDRVRTLDGCDNDVAIMEQLLRSKFGVPTENIRKLINSEATHAAIKPAFRKHLIGRAQAWTAAGKSGTAPAFIFHYSGHGSQAPDETGTEPDGLDETIVPHDSRTEGTYDIKDWELGQMLDELTGHSDNVTVILDCCHSGSGTRAIKPTLAKTRRCPADRRPQGTQRPEVARRTRGVAGPSDWLPGGRYVLFAGCRDREESNEHSVREGNSYTDHGALSYFLIKELFALPPDSPITYRELSERVRHEVHSLYEDQTPQCEGDLDRQIFGGARPQPRRLAERGRQTVGPGLGRRRAGPRAVRRDAAQGLPSQSGPSPRPVRRSPSFRSCRLKRPPVAASPCPVTDSLDLIPCTPGARSIA